LILAGLKTLVIRDKDRLAALSAQTRDSLTDPRASLCNDMLGDPVSGTHLEHPLFTLYAQKRDAIAVELLSDNVNEPLKDQRLAVRAREALGGELKGEGALL